MSTAEVAVPGSPAYLRETRKAKLLSWASLGYMAFEGIVAVAAGIVAAAALLVGLLGNALFGAWWLDPIVGLLIAAVAIQEGREAWSGDACSAH